MYVCKPTHDTGKNTSMRQYRFFKKKRLICIKIVCTLDKADEVRRDLSYQQFKITDFKYYKLTTCLLNKDRTMFSPQKLTTTLLHQNTETDPNRRSKNGLNISSLSRNMNFKTFLNSSDVTRRTCFVNSLIDESSPPVYFATFQRDFRL